MSTVNAINPNIDLSARIFNTFDAPQIQLDGNEYDVVSSFFESIFTDETAARNLTLTFFTIAEQTNTSVLTLLDQVIDQDAIQLTATMAYYLNGLRSPSTLLGVNSSVTPNFYAARNIAA